MHAANRGDMRRLTDLLTDDVGLRADGGGKVRGAATRPIRGVRLKANPDRLRHVAALAR